MDEQKEPYIEQIPTIKALYTQLQQQTREEVQRLSGKVWTDYNAHDPGVTLADIANNALTELDYKLGFEVEDYLTEPDLPFDAERFGLFAPADVYTTLPITEDDYRRILTEKVPELDNVQVICNPETGGYTFRAVLSVFAESSTEQIKKRVEETFNSRRNLCEWLEKVEIIQPDRLDLEAELEIEPGEDATDILARIYWCILQYLSGNVRISQPNGSNTDVLTPEVWLEGLESTQRVILSGLKNTEHELYLKLRAIKGISHFYTCYFMKEGMPQTRFSTTCSLHIPMTSEEFGKIDIRCGKMDCKIDSKRFLERLRGFYLMYGHSSIHANAQIKNNDYWLQPTGTWRQLFGHYSIANDFPDCYRFTPKEKHVPAFETYTRLYDWIIQNGLEELKALPQQLSLDLKEEGCLETRKQLHLKKRYLDFLDSLYGVNSHPAWLSEENCYGETPAGTIRRRTNFLRQIAWLQKARAKAKNLYATDDADAPTVKMHFCLFLGLNPNEGNTVSNVLPRHNLKLMENKQEIIGIADRIDSLLIEEQILRPDNVQPVRFIQLSKDEEGKHKEYAEMRASLAFFNENLITGDLFRGGTRLDNYKIVKTTEEIYMLIYRHQEKGGWTNLGQDTDLSRLEKLANILRRFLRELNRKSETLYIVEPVLADKARTFEVILVLPAWTYRFHSLRFRDKCRELLRCIVPAHLSGKICWLGEQEMRKFEIYYHYLMRTFTDNQLSEQRNHLMEAIDRLMEKAEEKQDLDDRN